MSFLAEAEELPTLDAGAYAFRPIRLSDAEDLFAIFGDPETVRFWSTPALRDFDAAHELVGEIHTCFETRSLFQWGIVRPADDHVIGTTTLCNLDTRHRRAEIGFALLRSEWGRGVMGEVLPFMVRYGFGTLDLHRIEADVDPRNTASLRLLEKLGFQREGYRRESYLLNDEVQDAVMLGLLRREFEPGREQ